MSGGWPVWRQPEAAGATLASADTVRGARAEGRFGKCLVPVADDQHRARLPGSPAYQGAPLTVECWAKLHSKSGFNILVASEPKSSPTHWEIYSFAGSGCFSAYLPGNTPSEIISQVDITDAKWHYVVMVNDGKRIRLYVDAKPVAEALLTRTVAAPPPPGPLMIGYVDHIGCVGMIDEVRVSSTARRISTIPEAPFEPDAQTLALCHFDNEATTKAPTLKGDLVIGPAGLPSQRRIWSETIWPTDLQVTGVRKQVVDDWKMQFDLLLDQMHGLGISRLPPNAREQVLDPHALIQPEDRDPVDVVLRRTAALLRYMKQTHDGHAWSAFRRSLAAIERRAREVPPVNPAPADPRAPLPC